MTEADQETVRELAQEFAAALARVLDSMTGQPPMVASQPALSPAGGQLCWWEQELSLTRGPVLWAGAPERTWMEIGGRTLRAAGIEMVEAADARNTWLEILSQTVAEWARGLGARGGREVACAQGRESPPPSQLHWAAVEVSYEAGAFPPMSLGFAPALLEKLRPAAPGEQEPEAEREEGTPSSRTLDLLLDVELAVSVSFGRAELPLNDILKLTTGSIIELNRGIREPVEVIVNNCVVARGEVVVMDGNYGVRIQQIVSPQERLRALR